MITTITHAEALLWLNDRQGQDLSVSWIIDHGDYSVSVLEGSGVLSHWGTDPAKKVGREDIIGLYQVGSMNLDITELVEGYLDIAWRTIDDDRLIALFGDSTLSIVEMEGS